MAHSTRRLPGLAALAVAGVFAAAPGGEAAADERRRPWYRPEHVKLQLAGNVGFLSPGAGWEWAGGRLHGDVFAGWVPRSIGGEDIWSLTGKLTWLPWSVPLDPRWRLVPLTGSIQITYTFGEEYFVLLPDHYPRGYHDFPTALRAGVGIGGAVVRRMGGGVRDLAAYWEFVALDAMIVNWVRNSDSLGAADVFSLALGIRIGF